MTSASSGFVHLHTHTEYSALDGMIKFDSAIAKIKADGNLSFAITDHGNMGGAWKFAKAARNAGIKPIIGIEAYMALSTDWRDEPKRSAPGIHEVERNDESEADLDDDETGKVVDENKSPTKKKRNQHITLLARNTKGWENLTRIVNEATTSYQGKYPLIDFALLKQFGEGVIALTGCLGGPVLGPMSRGSEEEARRNLERIIDAVGHSNVYVEVMEHGIDVETAALPKMAALAAEFGLPLVATNDSHYTFADDEPIHAAWCAVQSGTTLDDPKRFKFHGAGYHLRSEAEMRELRGEEWWQTAISNTVLVADRCEDVIPKPGMYLPAFDVPAEYRDARHYLTTLVKEGSARIYGSPMPKKVLDRLNTELAVIATAGFIDYFLIVWDVIRWARSQGIRVGPGRGSAAGSLISYCLGIVMVDPLEHNLLFERFLEPGRAGMPDVDVDFEQGRRQEVLTYLVEKYGRDRVARIGAYRAHQTKRAIRDAVKVLGLPLNTGTSLTKKVPIGEGGQPYDFKRLDDATQLAGDEFRKLVLEGGRPVADAMFYARGFAKTINGESIHPCGTLISNQDLSGLIPMRKDRSKANSSGLQMVTQWDGKDIDSFGMLKLDVLGLRNLDVISKAVIFIKATTGEDIDADYLPHPNTKGDRRVAATWELLCSGRTSGIFQMESGGMSKLAQSIQPTCLADLSAIVALYRPGPMSENMHVTYANRKAGLEGVDYSMWTTDPIEVAAIDSILGDTYGVFTYQEQLMRLGTVVSGFDANMRSKLRTAVSKKDKSVMAQVGEALIAGAPLEVRDPETGDITSPVFAHATAAKLYDSMKGSAEYLFNASHSFAYAQLAYVTAFLKANWPAEYGAAILAVTGDDEKRQSALRALREDGISVLAPDINLSHAETFPISKDTILLGLAEIKGVSASGTDIAVDRAKFGEFASITQMMQRVRGDNEKLTVDVGTIEALIESGALDTFGTRLGLMRVARALKADELPIPTDEWGILERSSRQRARLGVVMGTHPLATLGSQLREWRTPLMEDENGRQFGKAAVALSMLPEIDGVPTLTLGVLAEWSERSYGGGQMANFVIESSKRSVRCVLWNTSLATLRSSLSGIPAVGKIIAVAGKVSVRSQDVEDEDGNLIETVVTTEISAQRVYPVDVDDFPISTEQAPVPNPLRSYVTVAITEISVSPSESITTDDTGPTSTVAVPESTLALERSGRSVPLIFANFLSQPTWIRSNHRHATELADMIRQGRTSAGDLLEYHPSKGSAREANTHRIIADGVVIAVLVKLPTKWKTAFTESMPGSFEFTTETLPTWEELARVSEADEEAISNVHPAVERTDMELEEILFH